MRWLVIAMCASGTLLALWLILRCRLGFHARPLMERAQLENGRDDPYRVHWRCPRCWRRYAETTARPDPKLQLQMRRGAHGKVLDIRRRA